MSVSANSKADIIDSDLPFSVEQESMWGPGPAFYFQEADFIGLEWDKDVITPPIRVYPPFTPYVTDFQLHASTSGRVGLEYDFTLTSGSVDISYPVTSTIAFPGSANPGETVSLSSSFVNLNGKMKTFSPQATAYLGLPFQLEANLEEKLTFPDYGGIYVTKNLINIDFDKTYTFFDLSTGDASFEKDFPGGYGSIEAKIPEINTEATLRSGKFSASGSDDFITLTLDVDKVLTTFFPSIPPLGGTLAYPEDDPVVELSYDLLDVGASLISGFEQSFEFTPTLKVKYTLENGYEFVTDVGGAPVDFTIPSGVGDSLDVTATFFLENQFINNTDLLLTPAISLSVLSGQASLWGIELFDFGPLYSTEIPIYSFPINIFDKQFAIEGFQSFENHFSIDIVPVVPVPSALILGALGTSLTLMRKRRML